MSKLNNTTGKKNNDKEPTLKKDPVVLSELCPNKCGCESNCELDDYIFHNEALLDVYKGKMRLK